MIMFIHMTIKFFFIWLVCFEQILKYIPALLESHKEVSLIISLIITNNIFFYLLCVREPILNKHRGQLHYIFFEIDTILFL